MGNVKVTINEESIRRKIMEAAKGQLMEAAEGQMQEKLKTHGIQGVIVKAVAMEGDKVCFSFSGEDEDVKKAKAIFEIRDEPAVK